MNRVIKFRGKRVDNGEWVYGYYLHQSNKYHQILTGSWNTKTGSPYAYEVFPESVGQYTGLKNKNNVEIYEGDVIKDWHGTREVKFEFLDNMQGYDIETDDTDLEIIGNIYEHPNLINTEP